ncbi:InlB B-repeat-containing protein [Streptococcus sp.]|uniref:InlB B-repeat-containing protein n=1 Tax=Streptococcus sp. TaxID=1306 RepID=UPI0025F6C25E|nr:InlB B-repeat-containing protein [Streptococcus sp.]
MRKVLRHYWQKLKHLRRKQAILVIGTFVFVMTSYALILRAVTLDNDTASSEPGISLASSSSSDENVSQVASEPATSSTLASSSAISSLPSTQIEAQEQSSAPATIQEATTLTADGDGYTVSAVFDASSRLPVGVELKVKQVTSDSQDYQNALAKAQAALDGKSLAFATFFDISFTYQGKEVQPQAPVKVTLQTKDNLAGQEQALKVVHITSAGKTELINPESVSLTESQTKVTYTVSSFSVQGLVLEKTEQSSEATTSDTESSSSETSPSSQGQGTSTSATTTEAAENRTLTFVYENAEGQEESITTVTKKDGETLENLPATPFKTGYHFDHWQNKATGETVTADTVVNGDMTIEAVYTEIKIYTVTVHYYYHNTSKGDDVTFDTEIYQLEANETPYRINPPASTKVSKNDDSSLPQDATYYPETPLIELTKEELLEKSDADGKMELSIQYVSASSEYNIHYMLKDFDDKGYSEIEKVTAHGVIGSIVSPKVLDYPYATFEKTDPEELTKEKGQDFVLTPKSWTKNISERI